MVDLDMKRLKTFVGNILKSIENCEKRLESIDRRLAKAEQTLEERLKAEKT